MANLIYGAQNSVGPYGPSVGWVDFSEVPNLSIGQSYTLSSGIPGVGTISFTLTNRGPISITQKGSPQKIGTVYFGLSGSLAFGSTRDNSNTMTIEISNLSVISSGGSPIPYYKIFTMDVETTVSQEFWQMTTNGSPWLQEGIAPPGSSIGDPTISGIGTNTYRQDGYSAGATSPIISSENATALTFKSQNNATQLFAIGLYIPGSITLTKSVSLAYAKRNDILTYTLVLDNSTFKEATNVVLTDSIPPNTTYVQGSLTINGISSNQSFPTITLPNVGINSKITITFKVTIDNNTSFNTVSNIATTSYDSGNLTSNKVTTSIIDARASIEKVADKQILTQGDIITYTLTVKNTGTTTLNNVFVFDSLPENTTFINNSVTLNGTPSTGNITVSPGISLSNLASNSLATITFKVLLNTILSSDLVVNNGILSYTYIGDPSLGPISSKLISNNVTIPIRIINTTISKLVNKAYANRGDVLTYTLIIKNLGNKDSTNLVLLDTLSNNINLILGSIFIDGSNSNASSTSPLNLPNLAPNESMTIAFNVSIKNETTFNSILNSAYLNFLGDNISNSSLSNEVTTFVYEPLITISKANNKIVAKPTETINYTITIKNSGTTIANDVLLFDTLPDGTKFLQGSLVVNSETLPFSNITSKPGVLLPPLDINKVHTITYILEVVSVPSSQYVINSATLNYSYINNPSEPKISLTQNSNMTTVPIRFVDLSIKKFVDKLYIDRGETITYNLILTNKGNFPASNILLTDTISSYTTFINNSLSINGVPSSQGINGLIIDTVPPYSTTTISFQIRAN